MAEDFNSWTPYHYVHNNPLNLVDPTGMAADGYTVDKEGFYKKVNKEGRNADGENEYDVIYAKGEYSEAKKKDYDKTGDKTGLQISDGIIGSKETVGNVTIMGDDPKPVDKFDVKSDSEAQTLHKFLHEKTNVEWANNYGENAYGESKNILVTSHRESKVHSSKVNHLFFNKGFTKNFRRDHNHPSNSRTPGSMRTDRIAATHTRNRFPGAKFRLLVDGNYYPYE